MEMTQLSPPPLCIIQARLDSTRLPRKMLLPLAGETLIARAWRIACQTFGAENCVVAIPGRDNNSDLGHELRRIGARVFSANCADDDVLGRFHACAHTYRWQLDSVIVRYTPDDPFKSPEMMRRVIDGERLPVELGAEAFYLYELDDAHERNLQPHLREHITNALFQYPPPPAPPGVWTIDTQADYEAACASVAATRGTVRLNEWHEAKAIPLPDEPQSSPSNRRRKHGTQDKPGAVKA